MEFPVDEFFNTGLETDALVTSASGSKTIKVQFLNAYEAMKIQGYEFESAGPIAVCKTDEVSDVTHGDTIKIGIIEYRALEIQPDGTGITQILLTIENE